MSIPAQETNPWPGNWQAIYLPSHCFMPTLAATADPAPPILWQNYFNDFYQGQGYTFLHPLGIKLDMASIHYDICLPPFIKHWRCGRRNDIGVSLHWWVTGDLSLTQIAAQVQLIAHPDGAILGTPAVAQLPINIGPVACAGQMKVTRALSPVAWTGGTAIRENDSLHIAVARRANNNVINDTYLYEWFLFGITLFLKMH